MRTALAILFCSSSLLAAQGAPQPLPEVFRDAEQDWNLSWWGISGRSYFIEVSDDMQNWSFAPIIEPGNDEEIVWETGALSQRQFIRLTYTDQTAADLDAADFDADGLGNLQEISVHHTIRSSRIPTSTGWPTGGRLRTIWIRKTTDRSIP